MIYVIIYSCVSIFLTIFFTTLTWKEIGLSDVLEDYVKSLIKKRKEIKLRKEKIRMCIIRISSLDPYGEENWNE